MCAGYRPNIKSPVLKRRRANHGASPVSTNPYTRLGGQGGGSYNRRASKGSGLSYIDSRCKLSFNLLLLRWNRLELPAQWTVKIFFFQPRLQIR